MAVSLWRRYDETFMRLPAISAWGWIGLVNNAVRVPFELSVHKMKEKYIIILI